MRAAQGRVRLDVLLEAERLRKGGERFGVRRFETHAPGRVDTAEQNLQQVDGAAGVKAVGMGGYAAHGMDADRSADHAVVAPTGPVGPRLLDDNILLEGGVRQFGGDSANGLGSQPHPRSHRVGAVLLVKVPLGQDVERWPGASSVGKVNRALEARRRVTRQGAGNRTLAVVPAEDPAVLVTGETTVLGPARILDHQPAGVGIAAQVFDIHLAGPQQLVDQGQNEQPVGPRRDGQPFIGNGGVAGSNRVDGDELDAFAFQFAKPDLDGIGIVIFGDAEHHEITGVFPVRFAELPEGAPHGVEAGSRHVDRAEPTVCGIVGRAEL